MAKSADAFRTISEVADWLGLPSHVLRFWESKFSQVKPVKRAGGRRYYRPNDMLLLGGIKKLLHEDGMTIKGAQKMLRESGVKAVADLSQPLDAELDAELSEELETSAEPTQLSSEADAAPEAPYLEAPAEAPKASAVIAFTPQAAATDPADPQSELPLSAPTAEQAHTPSAGAENSALPSPDLPKDPGDQDPDVDAGVLSRLAAFRAPMSAQMRSRLEEIRTELRARGG